MLKALSGLAAGLGAMVGGAYLIALYVLTIWISVGALTAIQVRGELEANDQSFSFDNVQRAQDKLKQNIARITDNRARQDPFVSVGYDMNHAMEELRYLIGPAVGEFDIWQFRFTPEYVASKVECEVDPASVEVAKICDLVGAYEDLGTQLEALQQSPASPADEAAAIEAQLQIEKLQSEEPLFKFFGTYEFFDTWRYRFFLHVPGEVLVLLLTMAMGALGSVVTMTWLFIRQDSGLTLRRFVILPFIGSMSALIILVFLSAGQLTLTAGDATGVQLNPFVLSFVGIISGLLSERAYTRIADVGSNFFKVDDGQPRWATRLGEAMNASGVTTAELARHLGVSEEEAGRIVNESTTASLQQQRLIAACTRRSVRDIFTDVPPDAPSTTAAAEAIAVPDLTGLDASALEAALRAAGLRLGTRTEAPDDATPAGHVAGQDPAPDTRAPRGSRIDVVVAAPANGGGGAT